MNLYANKASSIPQKTLITLLEVAFIVLSYWILFGGGQAPIANLFGWPVFEVVPERRWVIFAFSIMVFARMIITMFYLMKRTLL